MHEFDFCPVLQQLAEKNCAVGKSGRTFSSLGALSTLRNLHTLRSLMMETKPKFTLEVGLCYGGSALVFTASHRDLGHTPSRQHIALDPFQESIWDSVGLLSVEEAGLSEYFNFQSKFSAHFLPELLTSLKESEQGLDLIYIDGSHIFEDVFVDAYFCIQLLSENGIVCFDDCTDPQVFKVLKFLRRAHRDSLQEVDLSRFAPPESSLRSIAKHMLNRYQMRAFRRIGDTIRPWDAPFIDF